MLETNRVDIVYGCVDEVVANPSRWFNSEQFCVVPACKPELELFQKLRSEPQNVFLRLTPPIMVSRTVRCYTITAA